MKLSVAMITYNHERFVAQAIESVLAQKVNFDYEIVIGEDCSSDGTRPIILEFQKRYPERIKLLPSERNIGAIRNFERTITACRGQYVAFLEGDDYWTSPAKLQRQVNLLDANIDRAICCHRVRFCREAGSENLDVGIDVFPPRPAGAYTTEDLLKGNFVMTSSTVLRRDLIRPFPKWFFKMKLCDWPLFALVAGHGKIELMDEIMAVYRIHLGSMWSSQPHATQLRECTRMLTALDKELGYRYTSAVRGTVASAYLDLANAARFNGSRLETAKYLLHYARSGGLQLPLDRFVAGLAGYTLIGSWYKIFSRAKQADPS
jgi:glycosyltransferase involved in cell wall biosynthesis